MHAAGSTPLPACPAAAGYCRGYLGEFLGFGLKQARSSLFGGLLLFGILLTSYAYPFSSFLPRYDFLFLYALLIQGGLLACKLESPREFLVIVVFHVLATAMEVFKTSDSIGSWSYPGQSFFHVGHVPLFAGFMYSAVGSYLARATRVLDLRYEQFPPLWLGGFLAAAAYLNFFTHHYLPDLRWLILAGIGAAYWKTQVLYRPAHKERRMPLLLGFALVAFFIWLAENLGTFGQVWLYPNQKDGWQPVGPAKGTAWFLLIQLSFMLVHLMRAFSERIPLPRPFLRSSAGS